MKRIKNVLKEIADALRYTMRIAFGNIRESVDILLVSAVISLIIFFAADAITGKTVRTDGVVVDKVYIPERNYMTISTTTDSHGRVSSHPVFHHDPAEWKFIVQDNSANVVNVWCSQSSFYRTSVGTQIPVFTSYGHWTGWRYFSRTQEY